MTLLDYIVKWHGGMEMNARRDFANALKVKPPRVSSWLTGRTWPEEDMTPKVCRLLDITPEQLAAIRPKYPGSKSRDIESRVSALEQQVRDILQALSPNKAKRSRTDIKQVGRSAGIPTEGEKESQ
jgi:transcriptional regulator with XRE-family HTH domain